ARQRQRRQQYQTTRPLLRPSHGNLPSLFVGVHGRGGAACEEGGPGPSPLSVPYPMGFWAKGLDGRIDDPNAGWKGRGVWSNTGNRTAFHMEGGKEDSPKVVPFQMRSDALAR